MNCRDALAIVRAYYAAWTGKRFDEAVALLSPELVVEVPINDYPTKESFAAALTSFGQLVDRVDLLSELAGSGEAMQLYDLEAEGVGAMRVVEHFTLVDGEIVRLRQIHDTFGLRGPAS